MPIRPDRPSNEFKVSRNEDEYFLKLDAELIKAHRERLDSERQRQERTQHFMKCPRCGGALVETKHGHVIVDVCSDCKGTWLDAGELDMIAHVEESQVGTFLTDLLRGLRNK